MRTNSAWAAIFRFELRYQLRQPLFWLVTLFLSAMLFIAGTGEGPGAPSGRLLLTAPGVIFESLLKWIYVVLFMMTGFVSSAAVRDFERRTSEMFFSKPISAFDYVTARFAGTMAVCMLAYVVGVIALAAGTFGPWTDAARRGAFSIAPYAFGLFVLVGPTVLSLGAAFYALATWTRSSLATYVGVVAFFAISALATLAVSQVSSQWIGSLLDPFGMIALSSELGFLTVSELNTALPTLAGALIWNRVVWLVLGFTALAGALAGFEPQERQTRRRAADSDILDVEEQHRSSRRAARMASPARVFTATGVFVQFVSQLRGELRLVFGKLPFYGILALALFVLLQDASSSGDLYGMPVVPRTHVMLESMQGLFSAMLLIVVVLYSGELIWKERAVELSEIHDSMPAPNVVYLGAKMTALVLVVVSFLLAGVVTLVALQLTQSYTHLEPGLYARGVAIAAVYPLLMLALASFFHVIAPNRFAGYGLALAFIISWDLLEELGFVHHLYRFASLPIPPHSDFNGYSVFLHAFNWLSAYWAFFAIVLFTLSHLLWKRGTDNGWQARWLEMRARFRGSARVALLAGVALFVSTGGWIFYNTNVLNAYAPRGVEVQHRANYERLYARYHRLELPRIVAVQAAVDIYPNDRRVEIRGSYRLRNKSMHPLREIHVSMPERARLVRLGLAAHEVISEDDSLGYFVYRLRDSLPPGGETNVAFTVMSEHRGLANNDADFTVLDNGTYFTKRDFFPVIGYDDHRQVEAPEERRREKLEPLRFASRTDSVARNTSPRAADADRVDFDMTVSTNRNQIAVTSGELEQQWVKGERRYFRYRANVPIAYHFAVVSAQYEVARAMWQEVAIEVYYHPAHQQNVARILDAAKKSVAYNATNFGPYPHRSLRIVEYPGYQRDGTSFPGMIALSELTGFNSLTTNQEGVDFPFFVTAHEVAHQWWGQQVVGANVQGVGTLHESLAQYSALMVSEHEFGRQKFARILEYEHQWYLKGRAGERGTESPLAVAERQEYVYYHKGALALNAVREVTGEAAFNSALSRYFARTAGQGPPYSTTSDLLAEIDRAVPSGSNHVVTDLFETLTTFNNKVVSSTVSKREDGKFSVRIELEMHKQRTDSADTETALPLDELLDIALYDDVGGRMNRQQLSLETRRITASHVVFEMVVSQWPRLIVIDPFCKLIDRDRTDNESKVTLVTAFAR